jgi:hypothetical protein
VARQVLTQAQRALKHQLKLDRWARKESVRAYYFAMLDIALEKLGELITDDEEPSDDAVVAMVAVAAAEDPSVTDHVLNRNVANPDWAEISKACAGTMYEAYQRAKDEGKWRPNA